VSQEPATPDLAEVARRVLEAANRRDLDTLTTFYASDAVYESVGLGTSFEDVTAIRGLLEEWLGSYEEFEMEVEEILNLGNGVGFAVLIMKGRPVGSSGHVQMRFAWVVTEWTHGLVARIRACPESDIDEARTAAERLGKERAGV
jgi:ketosteroid isomerase-like protein